MPIRKALLPNEYQEVEYIESTGTQYIDTGFVPNQDTRTIIFFSPSQFLTSNTALFGGRVSAISRNYGIMFGGSSQTGDFNFLYTGYGTDSSNTLERLETNLKYKIDKNKNNFYLNDILLVQQQEQSFTALSAYLFAVNQQNTAYYHGYEKLYSCKIYDNGTLVRDFVPCYRKTDGVIGLFDLVNQVFYTNAGTGTFSVGANVKPRKVVGMAKGSNEIVKAFKGEKVVFKGLLPEGFIECEYLESTGTQYIDTGFKPNDNTETIITYNKTSDGSDRVQYLFGVYNIGYGYAVQLNSENSAYIWGNYDSSGAQPLNPLNEKCVISFGKNGFYRDNVLLATPNSITFNSNSNMYLLWANGTSRDFVRAKLYSCKIYDNGTLVRNFIPCLDNTGIPCLYDRVSKTAFYNQGTGEFLYKVKIPNAYQQVEYIESSGTQYIDTGLLGDINLVYDIEFYNSASLSYGIFGENNYAWNRLGLYKNAVLYPMVEAGRNFSIITDTWIYVKFAYPNIKIKNSDYTLTNGSTGNYEIDIFRMAQYFSSVKIKYMRFWLNNTFVRCFVPCYHKSDNAIGLYDAVNDKFYTNAGTGTFIKGGDI